MEGQPNHETEKTRLPTFLSSTPFRGCTGLQDNNVLEMRTDGTMVLAKNSQRVFGKSGSFKGQHWGHCGRLPSVGSSIPPPPPFAAPQ